MAEADAEHRQLGALQHVQRDADVARVLGAARGPGRSRCCPPPAPRARPTTARRCARPRLVAVDLAQQVEEVERERVVVVDQERAHGRIYTLPNVGTGERPFVAPARRRDGHPRGCRHARDHARQARADRGAGSCGGARHRAVRGRSGRCRSTRCEPVQPPPGHDGWFPRAGYPDMLAMPDLETARIVPWHDRTALLLCDFVDRDGRAIPLSPRAVLRSVVERAAVHGRRADRRDRARVLRAARDAAVGARQAAVAARGGRGAAERLRRGGGLAARGLRRRGARDAAEYGLAVEACTPEAGPGQFEINLRAAPALQAADEAFLLKSAVKEIAARQGLLATFMAKPRSDWPGSSCHLHLSLARRRRPAGDAPLHRRPAGGDGRADRDLRPHAELLPAPTPRTRGRPRPRPGASTTAPPACARSAAATAPPAWSTARPGADANPYLAAAAALAAGLDGVRRACEPPPPVDGDVYALRRRRRAGASRDAGRGHRPARAQRAGPRLAGRRRRRRTAWRCGAAELAAQAAAVTDWETARYLEAL